MEGFRDSLEIVHFPVVISFKLLSSHASLVFVRAGLRPALFLITCVSVSVYLSEASLCT